MAHGHKLNRSIDTHALAAGSGLIKNPEDLFDPLSEGERLKIAGLLESFKYNPEILTNIQQQVFTMQHLRTQLIGAQNSLIKANETRGVPVARLEERVRKLTSELDNLLIEINKNATSENIESFRLYLRSLIVLGDAYDAKIAPLRKESLKARGESRALSYLSARTKDVSEKQAYEGLRKDLVIDAESAEENLNTLTQGEEGVKQFADMMRMDDLLSIRDQMDKGRFVVTADLAEETEAMKHLMRIGRPAMAVGDLGSGKTEMLKFASKEFLVEQAICTAEEAETTRAPLVFSGSQEASVFDLMGKLKLKFKDLPLDQMVEKFREEAKVAQIEISGWGSEKLIESALKRFGSGYTKTEFAMGMMALAITEGRPIILDEIDQMDPQVLTRLNEILNMKPGQKTIRIQENGDEDYDIKEGFIVLATANLKSDKHTSRKELDAATASRFVISEHPYLSKSDTYDLMLGYFINPEIGTLRTDLPFEVFNKLPRLVVAMKEIQELYGKRREMESLFDATGPGMGKKLELKKTVFSTRHLINILDHFTNAGMSYENFEIALGKEILSPIDKNDQLALTDILLRFGFFSGWTAKDFQQKLNIPLTQSKLNVLQGALTSPAIYDAEHDPAQQEIRELEEKLGALASMVGFAPQALSSQNKKKEKKAA